MGANGTVVGVIGGGFAETVPLQGQGHHGGVEREAAVAEIGAHRHRDQKG